MLIPQFFKLFGFLTLIWIKPLHSAEWGSWGSYTTYCTMLRSGLRAIERVRSCPTEGQCVGTHIQYKMNCYSGTMSVKKKPVLSHTSSTTVMAPDTDAYYHSSLTGNHVKNYYNQYRVKVTTTAGEIVDGVYDSRPYELSYYGHFHINSRTTYLSPAYHNDRKLGNNDRQVMVDDMWFDTSYTNHQYRTKSVFRATSSGSDTFYGSTVYQVTMPRMTKTIFVLQEIFKKTVPTENAISYKDELYMHDFYEASGALSRASGRIRTILGWTKDIEIRIHYPPQIDVSKGVTWKLSSSYENFVSSKFIIPEKNMIVIKVLNLVRYYPHNLYLNFEVHYASDGFVQSQNKYYTHADVLYCEGPQTCNGVSANYQLKTFRNTDAELKSVKTLKSGWSVPMRIRDKNTGKCWEMMNGIQWTSKCKDSFILGADAKLYYVKTGKQLGLNNDDFLDTTIDQDYNKHKYFTMKNNGLIYLEDRSSYNCLRSAEGGKIKITGTSAWGESSSCGSTMYFLHGYSKAITDAISMRSILHVNTPLGATTTFSCSPKKDLGVKPNCFYSLNFGSSWKAITPVLTSIEFYFQNAIYGKCGRATYNCKWITTEQNIIGVSLADYTAASIDSSVIGVYKVDDYNLETSSQASEFPDLGVSSLGLYKIIGGSSNRIMNWQSS